MNFSYIFYGLIIHSSFPLPDLIVCDGVADVVIRLEKLSTLISNTNNKGIDFHVTSDGVFLFWEKEAKFLVREGKEIIVDSVQGVDERIIRLLILGPVVAVLLHQRGYLTLHATTVKVNHSAVSFMGGAGCGKSALAVSLYGRGHGIVSDDVTAIKCNGENGPVAFPGFPQLRLWPEVVSFLGNDPERLTCIEPGVDKRALRTHIDFSEKPIPLARIYVLAEAQTTEITPLKPQDALVELIRYSYRASLLKCIGAERHLSQCASLVNKIPISRLSRPFSLPSLPEVARMIEEDLTNGSSGLTL